MKPSVSSSEGGPQPLRIALFTVLGCAVDHVLNLIDRHDHPLELAVVITCPGPRPRRCDAYMTVLQALWDRKFYNVDVVVSNKKSTYASILEHVQQVDLLICHGFPWILPPNVLQAPRLGAVNTHNSILPKYRGPNAFGWAIVDQEQIGFSTIRMLPELDTGPVLATEAFPLDINDTIDETFWVRQGPIVEKVLMKTITAVIEGHPGTPQNETEATLAPNFTQDFRWIRDFGDTTALQAHNKVRAFHGLRDKPKGVLATIAQINGGKPICITKTYYREEHQEQSSSPGTATLLSQDPQGKFTVQCQDTTLDVLQWHPYEGEDDKPIP